MRRANGPISPGVSSDCSRISEDLHPTIQRHAVWIAEASKDDALSAADLAMLNASMKIVERVTLKEAEEKPDTAN